MNEKPPDTENDPETRRIWFLQDPQVATTASVFLWLLCHLTSGPFYCWVKTKKILERTPSPQQEAAPPDLCSGFNTYKAGDLFVSYQFTTSDWNTELHHVELHSSKALCSEIRLLPRRVARGLLELFLRGPFSLDWMFLWLNLLFLTDKNVGLSSWFRLFAAWHGLVDA